MVEFQTGSFKIKTVKQLTTSIIILILSFLLYYAFLFIPERESLLPFFKRKLPNIILFASVIHIFIIFSRSGEKRIYKSIIIMIVSVPLLFLSFNYFSSPENQKICEQLLLENTFYSGNNYTLYITEAERGNIQNAVLISAQGKTPALSAVTDTKYKFSDCNHFSITIDKKKYNFTKKDNDKKLIRINLSTFEKFTENWRTTSFENSILLIIKISIFIFFLISLAFTLSISSYPIINFTLYSAALFPVVYFLSVYSKLILPDSVLSKFPTEAADSWGYSLILIISLLMIIRSLIPGRKKSARQTGIKK